MATLAPRRTLQVALHDGQLAVLDRTEPVVFALAGTGSGKTYLGPVWALSQTGPDLTADGLVVAPYKILQRTAKPACLALWGDQLGLGAWESKADGIWRFHAGGRITFASADTPESIEGAHVHWAWCDEAGQRQFPEAAWEAVQRRVRFHQGRILGTTTPYALGWLNALWEQWRRGARPDVAFVSFPSTANPLFPREEFERARQTLPAWQFRMFHLGEWDRPAGLVYADITDALWVDALPAEAATWDTYAGIDFGFNNPTAVIFGVLSPDDVLFVADEYYASGRTDADNARAASGAGVVRAWGDPSSPEAIEEFRRAGWRIVASERHEVKAGITEVIERIRTNRLRFVRGRLDALIRELDSYVWDERKPDAPVKLNDHGCDATRYLCWGLSRQRRARWRFA
ncbi:MAG: hypothetical protein GEU73_06045 [Chloroflexi bacterium]|nr:hypothetical protein [Chloroflexota bacterium]